MDADLTERIRALERAVSDTDDPPSPVPSVADVATDQADLAGRVDALEGRVADIESRQAAVEAYVDHVEHVNDTVERRADAALAAVDRLESRVDRAQGSMDTVQDEPAGSVEQVPAADPEADTAEGATPEAGAPVRGTLASVTESPTHVTDAAAQAPERQPEPGNRGTHQSNPRNRTPAGDAEQSASGDAGQSAAGGDKNRGFVKRLLGR